MPDWLSLRARTAPDAPALHADGRELSYAELDGEAARTARRLAAAGVSAGDRVATTLPSGVAFAALLHALPKLGAVLVPLNTRLSAAERRAQLREAGVRLVVDEPPAGEEAELPPRPIDDPTAPHTLLFTSGTTAAPKPVLLSFANHEASARASAANLGVEPGDRWLCVLPLFHIGGLAILIRSVIYGTPAVVHGRFDEAAVLSGLAAGEATLVSLVPTQLRRLIAAGLDRPPRLRAALLGGGPVPRDLLGWAAEHRFPALQTYGMTETASQIATLPAAEAIARTGSAGRPLPGVELRTGPDGELLVRGPMVAAGALSADGWLHTGDRGRLDDDGFLWIEGRLKDVIVTGGENVVAAEVEAALEAHPAVAEAAVVGEADVEWGERVAAYVALEQPVSEAELVGHVRDRLAAFKAPREIHFVSGLPRTASGKVLKGRLAQAAARPPDG